MGQQKQPHAGSDHSINTTSKLIRGGLAIGRSGRFPDGWTGASWLTVSVTIKLTSSVRTALARESGAVVNGSHALCICIYLPKRDSVH